MHRRTALTLAATAALVASTAACNSDKVTFRDRPFAVVDSTRVYDQIDRLANPLVSEVLIAKRNHPFHNNGVPKTDSLNFSTEIKGFVTGVAGRTAAHAQAISNTLLPDMLTVFTDKTPASAGFLGYAVTPGGAYGGRKLTDDVVDIALAAVFGTLVTNDPTGQGNCAANLCSDFTAQTSSGGRVPTNVFPYLLSPN